MTIPEESERLKKSEKQEISWHDANQRFLSAALATVRCELQRRSMPSEKPDDVDKQIKTAKNTMRKLGKKMHVPPALETVCATFGISPFERNVLLLCAGIELDSNFLSLCANAHGDPDKTYPTFSLALAALPESDWSALTPAAPLRHWRLIEVGTGNTLTHSQLRIDERILHYLTGISYMDQRLEGMIERLPFLEDHDLVPSHQEHAEQIVMIWKRASGKNPIPAIQLCGSESASKRAIALHACASMRLNLYAMSGQFVPTTSNELEALIRLWERDAALSGSVLLLDCDGMDRSDPIRENAINKFIQRMNGALIINTSSRNQIWQRQMFTLEIQKPTAREQKDVWMRILGTEGLDLNVEGLVSQFNLSPQGIVSTYDQVLGNISLDDGHPEVAGNELNKMMWDACRMQARPHMDTLAKRIEPVATWDDLILPSLQKQMIREVAVHVKQRSKVYNNWGFASKSSQGLGISALFAGSSGTGKTMAAEVLANELHLDLYRIDLSQVVSKYIGETEKNLRQVFDAAEGGGAILLFDEADALFGKRSEVKDSHDRYANIEVSYLLQRMEAYRGLAILTTNMKDAIDPAFLRRIRFIVQFPFPDVRQRVEIWKHIFPDDTPTEGLDMQKLARLNVAGGNIRNIAIYAAFLAAEAQEPVRMIHLMQAARAEYIKMERPLTDSETGG